MKTTVEILQDSCGARLLRNGEAYFIQGAVAYPIGADLVARYGGNSVRMGVDSADLLDRLDALGLTVLCHLPVRSERDGMDYADQAAVTEQRRRVMERVRALRDHPAVLMWELGNELEWIPQGIPPNTAVWDAINALAEEIHTLDSRPVITVVGGINWNLSKLVKRCPALDALGINAYGNLGDAAGWLEKNGWHKPYVVTEWGPTGFWQVPKTNFGLPIEETSSEKAARYRERYERDIAGRAYPNGRCLGSYVFLWKQHQEQTHTWFGMFDAEWRESEAVDVMRFEWTGDWPEHRAPLIGRVMIDGLEARASLRLEPGSRHSAVLSGVEGSDLTFAWEILPENTQFGYGGHGEAKPEPVAGIEDPTGLDIIFRAPQVSAAYRLFVTVYDRHNHFASANIPFFVKSG